jgi:TPR repeat protein
MRKIAASLLFAVSASVLLPQAAFADYARGKQAYDKKNYALALTELSAEAKREKPEAMHLLGMMYAEGLGVQRDDAQALKLFEKAAGAGYAPSQGMLGMFYAQGRNVVRDNAKSVEWTRRAAENGDALSQYMMGVRSLDGLGMTKNPEDAVSWFGGAAEQNYALAQYALAVMFGFGPQAQGESNRAREFRVEAAKWFILAIRQKSPELPKAQAKFDELKKNMHVKELEVAQARARNWRPIAGKKTGA